MNKMKQTTATNIFNPKLFDQNLKYDYIYLSHSTKSNIPIAKSKMAPSI